jgi:hypothetical protein
MLSDVLCETLAEIPAYQDPEDICAGLAPAISAVCEVMDALRQYLDTLPAPFLRKLLHELQAAIGRLDLSEIRAVRQRLFEDWQKAGPFSDPPESDSRNGDLAPTDTDPGTSSCPSLPDACGSSLMPWTCGPGRRPGGEGAGRVHGVHLPILLRNPSPRPRHWVEFISSVSLATK